MKYNSENKELWTQYYKCRYNLELESSLLGESLVSRMVQMFAVWGLTLSSLCESSVYLTLCKYSMYMKVETFDAVDCELVK